MAWKTTEDNSRDAIIIAVPQKTISEIPGGKSALCRMLENLHTTEENIWHYALFNIPDNDPIFAYISFGGRIRYRMNIIGYEYGITRKIDYGGSFRIFNNRNWLLLCGPVVKAPRVIPFTGYYGFRYTEKLF